MKPGLPHFFWGMVFTDFDIGHLSPEGVPEEEVFIRDGYIHEQLFSMYVVCVV